MRGVEGRVADKRDFGGGPKLRQQGGFKYPGLNPAITREFFSDSLSQGFFTKNHRESDQEKMKSPALGWSK
jgi:hypothetical protein